MVPMTANWLPIPGMSAVKLAGAIRLSRHDLRVEDIGERGSAGLADLDAVAVGTEIPPLSLLPIQLGSSLLMLAFLMRARGVPFRDRSALRSSAGSES